MAMETANSAVKPPPIVQMEGDNILWSQLVTELSRHYEGTLKVVFPAELDERTYSWFRSIEDYNFRAELRYSFDEMKPILSKPELLFLFVFKDELPEIVVLGHTNPNEPERVFRLDTFAINKRGKGIGHIVMDFIIKWARAKQYLAITLDTEETDEKGIRLQRFYEKHKFVVIAREPNGDITMKCSLVETNQAPPASTPTAGTPQTETPPANAPPASTPPTSAPPAEPPPTSAPPANTPPASAPPAETPPVSTPPSTAPPAPTTPPPASTPPPTTALVTTTALLATTTLQPTPTTTPPLTTTASLPATAPATTMPATTRSSDTSDSSTR
jgi:GNAT superfamily N-acetyltransferase